MRSPVYLLAVALHLVSGDSCGNCVFPFTYQGRVHKTCTTLDGDPKLWCSIQTDSDGNHEQGNWEYCTEPTCPGVTNDPIAVDPRNAEGNCVCGVPNTPQNRDTDHRIVGGFEAGVGEFPWQVALLFGSTLGAQGCGGTLITDRHVLTAAHCTYGSRNNPTSMYVAVGDTSLATPNEANSTVIQVKSIDVHENYGGPTGGIENDISIITLDRAVDLKTHPNIKPACLPAKDASFANADSTVSGWGTLSQGGNQVAWLNEVVVTTFAFGDCGSMNDEMTADMLCAGVKAGGKDSCQGDSGGPLVSADAANGGAQSVIGVVSWGYGCADRDSLGIYANVALFTEWIAQRIGDGETCSPPDGSEPTGTAAPVTTPSVPTTGAPETTTEEVFSTYMPYCFEEGKIPYLKKLDQSRTDTPEDCQSKCQDTADCDVFKWKVRGNGGLCILQAIAYKVNRRSADFTSGPRNC